MPLGALAALGGAYSSATIPLLLASAAAFLATGARIAGTRDTRALDLSLLAFVAIILLQLVPFPAAIVATLSPHADAFHDMLTLDPALSVVEGLSIDARATREGLATALSCVFLFWAARETFSRGGVRIFMRAIAWSGFAVSLLALIQRATAPTLLLWRWKPLDPGAQPYGPFVNRNHFATWLLMAAAVTAGYLVAHLRSHGFDRHRSRRLLIRDLLADGSALLLTGCLGAMLLALVSSLSRAALIGLAAALAFGVARGRRRAEKDLSLALGGGVLVVILAGALWINREGLLGRLETSAAEPGRPTVWRETMPIVADFWLTGTGVGTYGTAMLRYQVSRPQTLFNQAHNEYLQLVTEGGVPLTAVAVMASWIWLRSARRRLETERHGLRWIRLGAAAGICGIAVQSLFEAGVRMPANALLFAVLAALVAHGENHGGESHGHDRDS